MVRVYKPRAPGALARGQARTTRDCEAYDARRVDYENGARKFEFNRNIYGHKMVRRVLEKAQNGKCCFCEGKFGAFAPADIEHYRPKGAVRQDETLERGVTRLLLVSLLVEESLLVLSGVQQK